MSESYELGIEGELIAGEYLKKKGFEILEKRWRFGNAEIDLIIEKANTLHIVEVKTRSDNVVAKPEQVINFKKRKRLIEAADTYVREKNLDTEVQFDVIILIKSDKKWRINYMPDAFRPHF